MISITFFLLLAAVYVYLRVVLPLRAGLWCKLALAGLLLPPALRYVLLRKLGGGCAMAPDVAPWLLYGSAAVFVGFVMYFCAVFAGQVVRRVLLQRLDGWRRLGGQRQQRVYNWLHFLLLPVVLVLSGAGVWQGLALPRVKQVSIPFPIGEPLRVVLVSDLHISGSRSPAFLRSIVVRINELEPDAVLLVGDFMDGSPESCGECLQPLQELRARLGVYGVSGNHEYYSDYARWRPLLGQWGVRMLDNEWVQLPQPHALVLAGVTDESAAYGKMEGPDLQKALYGAPKGLPVLLLAHRPIVVREAAPMGVKLQLSGHLHGGLVWGLGLLVAATDAGYRAGLYQVGDTQLYVSPGAGSSARTPLRLGVPTEITLITLTPAEPNQGRF